MSAGESTGRRPDAGLLPHLVLVGTLVIWSLSFLAAARVRVDLGVAHAVAARFLPVLLGSAALLLWRRPRLPRSAWPVILAMGLLGVPGYNVFFFIGLKTVPSGTAALIIALSPVLAAVFARLWLGERFGPRKRVGLLLALCGVFVVIRYGTERPVDWPYLSAALLLAGAPTAWAMYTVLGKKLPPEVDTLDATLAILCVGSLPTALFVDREMLRVLAASPGALGASLYLGVFCTLVGYLAWNWALRRLPASEVAAFVFLNPPLANFWAWLLVGDRLRAPFVAGALVLLAGVALIVLGVRPRRGAPIPPEVESAAEP